MNVGRSTDADMISTNDPLFSRGISIPKEMAQLSVEAFAAGIIEGALEGLGFVRRLPHTARTRHGARRADVPASAPYNHPHQARQERDGARGDDGWTVGGI